VQPLLQWKSNTHYIFRVCVCVCVCVATIMQHAMRMRHIIWSARLYHIYPHNLIKGAILKKFEHKMRVFISSKTFA